MLWTNKLYGCQKQAKGHLQRSCVPCYQQLRHSKKILKELIIRLLYGSHWKRRIHLSWTGYGWVKDDQNKSLQPVTIHDEIELVPDMVLRLIKCGCHSTTPCSSRACSCNYANMKCTIICACYNQGCCNPTSYLVISASPTTYSYALIHHMLYAELADESETQGLKMNKSKTKVVMENDTPVCVNNIHIENVESYIYMGQRNSIKDKNQDKEIQRRITAGWTAFAKHRYIFKSNIGSCLKRQIYNSCVLPAMTYGAETWALTTQAKNKLAAAQTKMESSMLNITYRNRKTNIWVREKTN